MASIKEARRRQRDGETDARNQWNVVKARNPTPEEKLGSEDEKNFSIEEAQEKAKEDDGSSYKTSSTEGGEQE